MQSIALVADIHSNILALEAILKDIRRKHKPDRIISLGDQINLGPAPRETLDLLKQENAVCLHGNHERYVLSAMRHDPAYAGANFASLEFNVKQLSEEEITFPKSLMIDGVTFCHAMPDEDRFPIDDYNQALSRLQSMQFTQPTHIICGHSHNPAHYVLNNLIIDSIGSSGCMDDGVSGIASYTMLYLSPGKTVLRPCFVSYDPAPLKEIYIKSGFAEACPIMAHITCLQLQNNYDYLSEFVGKARALQALKKETAMSMETWQETDRYFNWVGGVSTAEFWRK